MLIDTSFLGLLFRFTLFAFLIYKIFELIKDYFIPFLGEQIKELRKQQMELVEKETLLASTLKRVDNQLMQQRKTAVLLEKKVQAWHRIMAEKKAEDEKEHKFHLLRVLSKRKLQEQHLAETKTVIEVIPAAIQDAHQELLNIYSGEKGEELLKNFVGNLEAKNGTSR